MNTRRTASQPSEPDGLRDYRTVKLPVAPHPSPARSGSDPAIPYAEPGNFEQEDPAWDEGDWEGAGTEMAGWDDAAQDDGDGGWSGERVPPSRSLRLANGQGRAVASGAGTSAGRALAQPRPRRKSLTLRLTGGVLVPGTNRMPAVRSGAVPSRARRPASLKKRLPVWITGNLVALLIAGLAFMAPSMTSTATASACNWYAVKPGNTLKDIAAANNTTATALAQANHISPSAPLYVGQNLCIPLTWYAQAKAAPVVPVEANLALPPGIMAGEPCTADRSIVWTGVIGRWTVPPGCFGLIYYPNPRDYMVNGQEIGGFGWCNWWPEALLRDPNALNKPGHSQPRVGVPVFYAPQPGEHVGHYAFVESIGPGPYTGWILISEMNMYWRGGGWAKVNYRYIRVDYPGAEYLY